MKVFVSVGLLASGLVAFNSNSSLQTLAKVNEKLKLEVLASPEGTSASVAKGVDHEIDKWAHGSQYTPTLINASDLDLNGESIARGVDHEIDKWAHGADFMPEIPVKIDDLNI